VTAELVPREASATRRIVAQPNRPRAGGTAIDSAAASDRDVVVLNGIGGFRVTRNTGIVVKETAAHRPS
jgi:hypothetical protein